MRLQVCARPRHESRLPRHPYENCLGLLNAVNAHFLHDSTNSVGRTDFCHTCNLALIFLVLALHDDALVLIADGPPLSRYNRILIRNGRLDDLIQLIPIKDRISRLLVPSDPRNKTAVKRWQVVHHFGVAVALLGQAFDQLARQRIRYPRPLNPPEIICGILGKQCGTAWGCGGCSGSGISVPVRTLIIIHRLIHYLPFRKLIQIILDFLFLRCVDLRRL